MMKPVSCRSLTAIFWVQIPTQQVPHLVTYSCNRISGMSKQAAARALLKEGATVSEVARGLGCSTFQAGMYKTSLRHSEGSRDTAHIGKAFQVHRVYEALNIRRNSGIVIYESNGFTKDEHVGTLTRVHSQYGRTISKSEKKDGDWVDVTRVSLVQKLTSGGSIDVGDIDGFGNASILIQSGFLELFDRKKGGVLFTSWMPTQFHNETRRVCMLKAMAHFGTYKPTIDDYNGYVLRNASPVGFQATLVDATHYGSDKGGIIRLAHKLKPISLGSVSLAKGFAAILANHSKKI